MRDAISYSGLGHRRYRIPSPNDHCRSAIRGIRDCVRDADRALIERRLFEYSHRAVPDDCLRILQSIRKARQGLDPDVHARVTGVGELDRNGLSQNLLVLNWLITVYDLMIGRQQ